MVNSCTSCLRRPPRNLRGDLSKIINFCLCLGIDRKGRKTLNSDTKLMVNVEVPPSRIPFRVIQTGGNFILQASLDIIVPTFLRVLSSDFHRWSEGNDVRDPLENASFLPIDGNSDSDSGSHGGSGSNSGGDHDSGI